MNSRERLESEIKELRELVADLRGRIGQLEAGGSAPAIALDGSAPRSRRDLLKLGGVAALGAVGAAALRSTPASANSQGMSWTLGGTNTATATTNLQPVINDPAPVLQIESLNFSGTALSAVTGGNPFMGTIQGLGESGAVEGVDGWAAGSSAYGVYGFTDAGTGVTGESSTGVSLYARRSGRIRQDPRAAGVPNYITAVPEQVRDNSGTLWINNPGSTATVNANWRRVNTVRFDSATSSGAAFKPYRVIDTRLTIGPRSNGSITVVTVAGQGSGNSFIPNDAIGVVGNLTAVDYPGQGWLTIMPQGASYNPSTDPSSVNFITGQAAIANSFICGLVNGQVQVFCGGTSNFIIDVTGYIQ